MTSQTHDELHAEEGIWLGVEPILFVLLVDRGDLIVAVASRWEHGQETRNVVSLRRPRSRRLKGGPGSSGLTFFLYRRRTFLNSRSKEGGEAWNERWPSAASDEAAGEASATASGDRAYEQLASDETGRMLESQEELEVGVGGEH